MFTTKNGKILRAFNDYNYLDWLVLLFLLLILYILNRSDSLLTQKVNVVGVIFFAIRLLGVLLPVRYVGFLFSACIVGACLIETIWGICQLCHPNKSITLFLLSHAGCFFGIDCSCDELAGESRNGVPETDVCRDDGVRCGNRHWRGCRANRPCG